jgi:hypothetical protein
MPAPLVLFPFRFFDVRRRRWHRGRYVATIDAIAERHAAFQITGTPEVRRTDDDPAASRASSMLNRRDG